MKAITARFLAGLACGVFSSAALGETPSFKVLKLQGNPVQWRGTVAKQGTVVTYAVVAEDMAFDGARNCRNMTRLESLLTASQVSAENARTEISTAFGMWEAVANISFREEKNVARADIVIGVQLDPVGWAFAEVFYDPSSRGAVKPISRSLICLNPERAWKVGFDGDLQRYDIRYTLAHEIGHAIGLDHPPVQARSWTIPTGRSSASCSPAISPASSSSMASAAPTRPLHRPSACSDNKNRKAPIANNVPAVQRPAYWVRLGEPDKQPGMKAAPSP